MDETLQPAAVRAAVQRMYDADAAREWARSERHRTEFALTRRALAQALPPPPARVLDCGGGPGRYAIELARQGYAVTLFDLSPGNLARARAQAVEAGVTLVAFEQGDAMDLGRFAADSFDAVLLMGSLWALMPGITGLVFLIIRTALEDRMLHAELPGYRDYAQEVPYRLIPSIW